MDCNTFQAQFPLSIAVDPSPVDRKLLADHAAGCPPCRKTLQEWEDAQRALESSLGSNTTEPRRLQSLSETLYAERFGSALELNRPLISALHFGSLGRFLIGGAAGLLAGYVVWGSAEQNNQLTQLMWLEQMMMGRFGGGFAGGPGAMALLPGAIGTVGNVIRDIFGIFVIVWLCRSRLWDYLFPVKLPKGIHMARLLSIPLVMIGIVKILNSALMGPSLALGWGATTILQEIPMLGGIIMFVNATWSCGFWVVLFLLLFTAIENLSLQYVQSEPQQGHGR